MARTKVPARVRAERVAIAKVEGEVHAKAEQEAVVKAEQEAPDAAEQEVQANLELDHDDFGPNQSKVTNVIDSKGLERDAGEKQGSTFSHPALEALVEADEETPVEIESAALAQAGLEARVETEIAAFQNPDKEKIELAATVASLFTTSFETIAVEAANYSKKSIENGTAFLENLFGAKSFDSAIQIQSEYAKTSYTDFIAYLAKIGDLYSKLTQDSYKRHSHLAR